MDEELLTLPQACERFFGGSIKVATLRAEAARGRLTIFRIGKRDFTTARNIREMVNRCRVNREAPTCTSIPRDELGQSETDRISSAQAAARASVQRLKDISKSSSVVSIARSPAQTR